MKLCTWKTSRSYGLWPDRTAARSFASSPSNGLDLEVDGVSGLLLVLVHDLMKARKPGRLRGRDGDRRLRAEGDG